MIVQIYIEFIDILLFGINNINNLSKENIYRKIKLAD